MLYKTLKGIINCMEKDPSCNSGDDYDVLTCYRRNFNLPVDFSNETDLSDALLGFISYNQPTVIPEEAENLCYMFCKCTHFNQYIRIPAKCKYLNFMLANCTSFNNEIIIETNTLDCEDMLYNCSNMRSDIHCSLEQFRLLKLHIHCSKEYVYDIISKTAFIPSYGVKYRGNYIKYDDETNDYIECDLSEFNADLTDLF